MTPSTSGCRAHPPYAAQVDKEQRWLPLLPPHLPLPIAVPVARGVPGLGYPHPWSVLQWIPGEPASAGTIGDLATFAVDLAAFLVALRGVDATTGPAAGTHNFFRGGPLEGVGDPACDTVIAWTLLSGASRAAFRAVLRLDDATWARGRGWALWKALITLAGRPNDAPARHTLDAVLADHARES